MKTLLAFVVLTCVWLVHSFTIDQLAQLVKDRSANTDLSSAPASQFEFEAVACNYCFVNNGGCDPNARCTCVENSQGRLVVSCNCLSPFNGDGYTCDNSGAACTDDSQCWPPTLFCYRSSVSTSTCRSSVSGTCKKAKCATDKLYCAGSGDGEGEGEGEGEQQKIPVARRTCVNVGDNKGKCVLGNLPGSCTSCECANNANLCTRVGGGVCKDNVGKCVPCTDTGDRCSATGACVCGAGGRVCGGSLPLCREGLCCSNSTCTTTDDCCGSTQCVNNVCRKLDDSCKASDCSNHGTASGWIPACSCTCTPAWIGRYCQTLANVCAVNNGGCDATLGLCTSTGPGTRTCACKSGYFGSGEPGTCAACTPILHAAMGAQIVCTNAANSRFFFSGPMGDSTPGCLAGYYINSGVSDTCTLCKTSCSEGSYLGPACTGTDTSDRTCNACRTSCSVGSYLGMACSGSGTSDRACTACRTSCPTNNYLSAACTGTETADRTCTPCSSCMTGQYISNDNGCVAGTGTANRMCTACTSNCGSGKYLSGAACTGIETTDRACSSCRSSCSAGNYLSAACCGTETSDRTCTACKTSCPSGNYLSAACMGTETADRTCTACKTTCGTGNYLSSPTCMGTETSDRTCAACKTSCSAGSYLSAACCGTETADRTCTACKTSCPTNNYLSAACMGTETSDRTCSACSSCTSGQYISNDNGCTAGTGTSNRVCTPCKTTCGSGNYLSSAACTGTEMSDRTCSACKTSCTPGSYLSAACCGTETSDRTCTACKTTCSAGNYLGPACTTGMETADRTCTACKTTCGSGSYLSSPACVGTETADRSCTACKTMCSAGEYLGAACCGTETMDRSCNTCKSSCSVNQYISAACTGSDTSDRTCTMCQSCTSGQYISNDNGCTAGTATSDRACTACTSNCGTGMYLSGAACTGSETSDRACSACKTMCSAGQYLGAACCGTETMDRSCNTCQSCTSGQYISNDNGCAAGTATSDRSCTACTSNCGSGMYLSGAACTGVETSNRACSPCTTSCMAGSFLGGAACCGTETTDRPCTPCKTCTSGQYISDNGGCATGGPGDRTCSDCTSSCSSGQYLGPACTGTEMTDRSCNDCMFRTCSDCGGANAGGCSGSGTTDDSFCFGCFSLDSQVMLEDGRHLPLRMLQAGDRVASVNAEGQPEFTTFYTWYHKGERPLFFQSLYYTHPLSHDERILRLSMNHLIFTIFAERYQSSPNEIYSVNSKEVELVYSSRVRVGDYIFVNLDDDTSAAQMIPIRVEYVHREKRVGYGSPATASGTILVDDVAASVYAGIVNKSQSTIHASFEAVLMMYEYVITPITQWDKPSPDDNILVSCMKNILPFHEFSQADGWHWWRRTRVFLRDVLDASKMSTHAFTAEIDAEYDFADEGVVMRFIRWIVKTTSTFIVFVSFNVCRPVLMYLKPILEFYAK